MPTTRSKSKDISQQECIINKKQEEKTEDLVKESEVKESEVKESEVKESEVSEIKKLEEPVCFICWDISQPTNKIIKIKELILFNSGCNCNSEIHINCLFNWINVSKSCPICRINITVNTRIYEEIDYYYRATIMMKIKYNISNFVNMCLAVVMMLTQYLALLFALNAFFNLFRELINIILYSN